MTEEQKNFTGEAYTFSPRAGSGVYRNLRVTTPTGKTIEITESPTGRSLQIYVDGEPWEKEKVKK